MHAGTPPPVVARTKRPVPYRVVKGLGWPCAANRGNPLTSHRRAQGLGCCGQKEPTGPTALAAPNAAPTAAPSLMGQATMTYSSQQAYI